MKYTLDQNFLKIEISSLNCATIEQFMDRFVPSKKIRHLLIQNKWLYIDDLPARRSGPIEGKEMIINLYPEENTDTVKTKLLPQVVYEDPFIVIVNKPVGILVHGDGSEELTLQDIVYHYLHNLNPNFACQPLHRLDKDTSGLVVFSKSSIFQPLLDQLMTEKKFDRHYLAFVQGNAAKGKKFVFKDSIGKDRHDPHKQVITKNGQPALTTVKCIASKDNISVFRCILSTGRTHQIRLHCSFHNYPILNDPLYGVASKAIYHMGLVADELIFYHPFDEKEITVKGKLLYEFEKLLDLLQQK